MFRKGDVVVHPEHGAAVIEDLSVREVYGEKRKYYKLRVSYGDLTLMVPVDSTEEVGLRSVVSKNEVKKVLNVLKEDESKMAANWSRRFKNNIEKLRSGDIYQVAEVVRNLSIREREYVHAAVALGSRHWRVLMTHVLPNTFTPWLVVATLDMARVIVIESALSFLRLGVQPPTPTWGGMLADGRVYLSTAWWLATFPGLAILVTVLGINLFGDGLRDTLDPRLKV